LREGSWWSSLRRRDNHYGVVDVLIILVLRFRLRSIVVRVSNLELLPELFS
jgi:hypothetical protein